MIGIASRNRCFRVGATILAGLGAVLGGTALFRGIDLNPHILRRLHAPSARFLLGTDALGRDILSCLTFGTLLSLAIALAVMTLAAASGAGLGFLAGWLGGIPGTCIMRVADLALAFPGILLALVLIAFWGQGVLHLVLALAAGGWAGYARLVRAEVLKIREQDFILAARGFNASSRHIACAHVLPLVFPVLLTQAVSGIAAVILAEASLSFLGLGLDPRLPTLGGMIDAGRGHLFEKPGLVLVPGTMLVLLVAAFLLLAEGFKPPAGEMALEKFRK